MTLARYSLAFLWLYTALISITLGYQQGLDIMKALPLPLSWHPTAIYLGATLDALLGIWLLLNRRIQLNCQLQMILILGYSGILLLFAREHFTHPFAPVIKNIPILALIWWLKESKK